MNKDEKQVSDQAIDIFSKDGFFNKPMPDGKHWRVALVLNDVHFGCCLFVDEATKDEFVTHYTQLLKNTGKKWGLAVAEFVKEK